MLYAQNREETSLRIAIIHDILSVPALKTKLARSRPSRKSYMLDWNLLVTESLYLIRKKKLERTLE